MNGSSGSESRLATRERRRSSIAWNWRSTSPWRPMSSSRERRPRRTPTNRNRQSWKNSGGFRYSGLLQHSVHDPMLRSGNDERSQRIRVRLELGGGHAGKRCLEIGEGLERVLVDQV